MQPENIHQPPANEGVEEVAMGQPARGLSLVWGLFWRVVVTQALLGSLFSGAYLVSNETHLIVKASVFFGLLACLHLIAVRLNGRGALWLIWGGRLNLAREVWLRVSMIYAMMYGVLALLNILVAYIFPIQVWLIYKVSVPLLVLVAVSAYAPRFSNWRWRSSGVKS